MPDLAGAVPHSRLTILSNKTALFFADFDREPDKFLADLAKHAGLAFEVFVTGAVDRRGQYVRS
jgi:hypothetical protein